MRPRCPSRPLLTLFSALAGGGDAAAGLLLLASPTMTLRLLGITAPPGDAISLRFIGAFVAAVGLCHALPFLARGRESWTERLIAVFEATALIRLCVATFLGVGMLRGELVAAWATVAGVDLTVACLQLWLRRRLGEWQEVLRAAA